MKRKLSIDNQLLACAQEDSQVKKQLLEKLDNMDKKCSKNMERMSSNVEKLIVLHSSLLPTKTECLISSNSPLCHQLHCITINQLSQHVICQLLCGNIASTLPLTPPINMLTTTTVPNLPSWIMKINKPD